MSNAIHTNGTFRRNRPGPLRRIARALSAGLALGLAAGAAQAGSDIMGGIRVPIDPARLLCPDLAVSMRVVNMRMRPGQTPMLTHEVRVKNVGTGDYVSRPNQQGVRIYVPFDRRLYLNPRVPGNIRVGQEVVVARFDYPYKGGEFGALEAELSFDPDIGNDSNPRNDDCNASNNRDVLTDVEQQRQMQQIARMQGVQRQLQQVLESKIKKPLVTPRIKVNP